MYGDGTTQSKKNNDEDIFHGKIDEKYTAMSIGKVNRSSVGQQC
jgi:hypothetical protein